MKAPFVALVFFAAWLVHAAPRIVVRAGGFGSLDPRQYNCSIHTITHSRRRDSTSFRLKESFIAAYSMGGFATLTAEQFPANYSQLTEQCLEECTYAQYPANPQLNVTKCEAIFVAKNASSTYTPYVNNSSPEAQAYTHSVCYLLRKRVKQRDLFATTDLTWTNAVVKDLRCPGVVFDPHLDP